MSTTTQPPKQETNGAPQKPPTVVTLVSAQVSSMVNRGLVFPADYSVENAIVSAKLELQKVVNKDSAPVVDDSGRPTGVCTPASMVNAMVDMCVQGLNVAKKQCYFIVYGNQLTLQRSYFGDLALACRIKPNIEPYFDVIYEGEDFKLGKQKGKIGFVTVITKHEQPFPRQSKKIVGAYAGSMDKETGEDLGCIVMDWDQIQMSWAKSKTKNERSFHAQQPDQACLRTVIRRWAKPIINSASDAMLLESIQRQDDDRVEAEVADDAAANANGEILTIPQAAESVQHISNIQQPASEPEKVAAAPAEEKKEPF